MIVLDTHAWVRWLHPELGQPLPEALRAWLEQTADDLAVSVISCLEVAQLVKRGILDLPLPLPEWFDAALAESEIACPTCIATLRIASSLQRHRHAMRFWSRRMASYKIIRTYAGYGRRHRHELGGYDALHDSQSEFDHVVFMEGAALFASIGPIRISNTETKRQPIRQVVPEYPTLLPATSRYT